MEIKEILEKIALPARSNKHGFKETDKLEAIEALLRDENSPFYAVCKTPHAWIFSQKPVEKGDNVILISSHCDIVSGIKHPFSELDEETGYFKGTYDNLGTNAAAVHAMLSGDMPSSSVFAFTDEEETGRCLGAKDALSYVRSASGREPIVFALDVTDEGYDHNRLFTVEGFHAGHDAARRYFLGKMLSLEGEEQSFEVVKLKEKDDVSILPAGYIAKDLTVFDESVFYAQAGCTSCSLCLPGEGMMHSDSGFYVKEPVMKGYTLCLAQVIREFSGEYPDLVNEAKKEKDDFVKKAKETPFRKVEYLWDFPTSHTVSIPHSYESFSRDRFSELTDEEYQEMVDYNRSFGIYTENEEYNYFVDQMLAEAYEIADGYNEDEFEVYCQDMMYMYGIAESDYEEMSAALRSVWNDVKRLDNDEDYDDYSDM